MQDIEKKKTDIGNRLQQSRLKAKYTQEDLAELLGITPQSVSNLESGKHFPKLTHLITICELLHVSCDYLIWGKSDEEGTLPDIIDQYYHLPMNDKKSLEHVIYEFLMVRERNKNQEQ